MAAPQVWEASAKRSALEFRMQELGFHVDRFTALATQGSVLAGFAFEGLVHMEVPEDFTEKVPYAEAILGFPVEIATVFWVSGSLCMMFALYVLIIGSIACIMGHQLALFGADGKSLEDAVTVLRRRRFPVFMSASFSLVSLVVAAICMAYIKFGAAGPPVAVCFAGFCLYTFFSLFTLISNLGGRDLVSGQTQIYTGKCDGWLAPSASGGAVAPRAPVPCPSSPRRPVAARCPHPPPTRRFPSTPLRAAATSTWPRSTRATTATSPCRRRSRHCLCGWAVRQGVEQKGAAALRLPSGVWSLVVSFFRAVTLVAPGSVHGQGVGGPAVSCNQADTLASEPKRSFLSSISARRVV